MNVISYSHSNPGNWENGGKSKRRALCTGHCSPSPRHSIAQHLNLPRARNPSPDANWRGRDFDWRVQGWTGRWPWHAHHAALRDGVRLAWRTSPVRHWLPAAAALPCRCRLTDPLPATLAHRQSKIPSARRRPRRVARRAVHRPHAAAQLQPADRHARHRICAVVLHRRPDRSRNAAVAAHPSRRRSLRHRHRPHQHLRPRRWPCREPLSPAAATFKNRLRRHPHHPLHLHQLDQDAPLRRQGTRDC